MHDGLKRSLSLGSVQDSDPIIQPTQDTNPQFQAVRQMTPAEIESPMREVSLVSLESAPN